ncbi:cytochrome b/b6 domain-containing protein [Tepidibacillus infernus]|uniref:formate dehydrogenase subunit gamma n=1 Tax=Tepidibacillus TaxID=1494427 RepID=UPI000853D1C9|nr:cytochrome b/b6 domain-containing protein [Tepidibacillus sp. HK-1]GBF12506.1 formate dehydrogenase, cytochrome b556(fdo) subunit [Tepidibacillus sp. HK-1]
MSKAYKRTKYVKRYCVPDQIMHWMVALGFVLLLVTGFMIFFKGPASLLTTEAGMAFRQGHRIGAILFIGAPLIYFLFSSKRWGFLVAFKWGKYDFGWLKAAPKHYFIGGEGMPPQDKYNTGQKLYFLVVIVFGLLLAMSGFALWFDWFNGSLGVWMLVIHDVSALIITIFFGIHLHLTVFHARERASFNAMTTGWMEAEYAEHHHKLWFDKVKYDQMITCGERKMRKMKQVDQNKNNTFQA